MRAKPADAYAAALDAYAAAYAALTTNKKENP